MFNAIKKFRWGELLIAIILCVVGVCFIGYPLETMKTGSYIIGFFTLVGAIVQAVNVLADKKRGFGFAIKITTAILTIIAGAVCFIIPEQVARIYPMFIGLFIVINGSFKLQTVTNAKRYSLKMWWFLLIFVAITIILGFMVIRIQVPEDSIRGFTILLGASLFICGVCNFFSLFYFPKILKRATKEVLEHDGENVDDAIIADSDNIDE